MPSEEICEKIIRYGQFLERALGKREDQQVLAFLEKLDRLPISLDHLQETGIGKTVNGYRKCSDPVGMKAKSIVNKWKGLVQAAIAEDQSQRSDNSPTQTDDGESEHMSHSNATDDDISTHDSLENNSIVIHKNKERSNNRSRQFEMEAHNSKVKRKFETSRDEKPAKKPCDNPVGMGQNAGDRSAATDSRDTSHQLKELLPCNGLSKVGESSDVSNKAASYQSQLDYSGKGHASTNRDSSRGSSHSNSHKGQKAESHKAGSSSHSNRDVSHRHRSSEKDGKNSASLAGGDSACKGATIFSDSEVLSHNGTVVKAQSAEPSSSVSGQNPRNFDLSNILKRKTNDSSYSDMPQKKQLLESDTASIIADIDKGSTDEYRRSALAKKSGHCDHASHKDSSSKSSSSSLKDSTPLKEDSLAHLPKENCSSRSKSSHHDKSSMSREASSSKESLSGRHQSHRESAGKHSSRKESSATTPSHKELLSKHVSHKDLASKTSSVKESSSELPSQRPSSGLPPVCKESPRKVSREKLTSLEESLPDLFPDDTSTKSSSVGKFGGSGVSGSLKAVDDSLRAEMGVSESQCKPTAKAFSALDSEEEANSCGVSFEEMLNYGTASTKTKPSPSKAAAADMSQVLKKNNSGIAKGYSGSQSSVSSDSSKPITEKDSAGRKVSQKVESSSKKNDRSSKSEESSRVNRKDYSKANSSHHSKLESSSSTKQDRPSGRHSKSDGSSSKEHIKSGDTMQKSENITKQEDSKSCNSRNKSESSSNKEPSKSSSNHSKSESSSNNEPSKSSSNHSKSGSGSSKEHGKSSGSSHQKLESSAIREPSKSGGGSHRPESSKKQYGDGSMDMYSQLVEQRKEARELGYRSDKSTTDKVFSLHEDSDADSEDLSSKGKSFEDFLNYNSSVSQNKSVAKSSKLYASGSKDKIEKKLVDSKADCVDGLSFNHPLVNVPLPKQEELNLSLDDELCLPLYPSMRQELQAKKINVEKLASLERRYGQKMIYSGKKQATVPTAMTSLFAACMQVLQENIDDITFVGYIPADILKPVLDLCSVIQLERLEFYNPQFVGDTEDLWKLHCNRDFRGREPDELESWRELYLRLQDARNKRLESISQSVMANKKRAEKEVPRIQLTYVDHGVCAGRRTSKKLAATRTASAASAVSYETSQPRSKQEIIDSLQTQVSKPMIRRRGGGGHRPEITGFSKPAAHAPLMQKTLKFMKGMKR